MFQLSGQLNYVPMMMPPPQQLAAVAPFNVVQQYPMQPAYATVQHNGKFFKAAILCKVPVMIWR